MKKIFLLVIMVSLAACSTMQPPRYSISVDNVQALKEYENVSLMVSDFTQSTPFNSSCRLMGPIEPADGLTFPEFIGKAFNDELKMAGIYSETGTKISGDITKVDFSSTSGLTNGFWDISIVLKSSNGNSIAASNKYTFKSGFDAITACNATADALSPAVQDLIQSAVTNPEFKKLL
ncbi:hypothetical protein [Teredinibacter purpureus]|uniref:hypothetical protein n=1 Tax=Teredinibacter purpureus TaxID=2731756 RepID=UPI0005F7BE4E|nr:hypothetical protein [Teredinibacter purpureus]